MFLFLLNLSIMFMMMYMLNLNLIISNLIYLNLEFNIIINKNNIYFSLIVILISILVLFYSKLYFNFNINMSYKINIMIFILSMLILINSENMIMMIIGWDGLGISSFYLVSFYSNYESAISSMITFFFNRLGDSLIILVISSTMNYSNNFMLINMNTFIMTMMFIGLITKSSQIPFGVWLPMAMSAPTPISSLVHSSTLVTAGIFLLMKMNFMFFIMEIQIICSFFSILTFMMGGMFSFSIMDFKKSVAFSTLSQLGFILFSISMGNITISFYHLIFHALFKSSLFMNLGFFMLHSMSIQDQRMMKNISNNIFFKLSFLIPCLNLMGIISTLGFLSKDLILIYFLNFNFKMMIFIMMFMGCIMTCCYSMKFIMIILEYNYLNLNLSMKMKMNLYFCGFIINTLIMMIFNINFNNMLFYSTFNIIDNKFKFIFYSIIIISMFMMKLMMNYMNLIMMMFSSMLMILDHMNIFMKMMYFKIMNKFLKFISKEEYIQLNILMNLYKFNFYNFSYSLMMMYNLIFLMLYMMFVYM